MSQISNAAPMPYHDNPRPEFPPPALYSAIREAWKALRDSNFADECGPLRNRHEFMQIDELLTAFQEGLRDDQCCEIIQHYM